MGQREGIANVYCTKEEKGRVVKEITILPEVLTKLKLVIERSEFKGRCSVDGRLSV